MKCKIDQRETWSFFWAAMNMTALFGPLFIAFLIVTGMWWQ